MAFFGAFQANAFQHTAFQTTFHPFDEIDNGHDGNPGPDSSEAWDEHRLHRERLRETIAKAKRKANGEVEPQPEQVDEPGQPQTSRPILSKPNHAALIAALLANSGQKPVAEPAPAENDDELMAIMFLAA
ncbi:hypothetical protein [Mesorhizobium sp. B2-4-15]|uniref:hypothetical protein n=1 Tax=Mesorhizobium sp. B2-4-15 TaxID=2589934 RepID=UPI0015EE69EF|nr:hypothetical protein [Mesorhizobium sp. B2-4-15]